MAPAECVTDAKANHVVVVVVVVFTLVQVSSLAPPSPSAALVAASAVDRGTDDEGAMGSGGGAAGSVAKSSDGSGSEGIDGESVVPLANDEPIVPLGNDSGTMRMLQFKAQQIVSLTQEKRDLEDKFARATTEAENPLLFAFSGSTTHHSFSRLRKVSEGKANVLSVGSE